MTKDAISNLFKIKDSKTMVFGATIVDTDEKCGYVEGSMARMSKEWDSSPNKILHAYPKIMKVDEEEAGSGFPLLAIWNTGFTPVKQAPFDAANMSKRTGRTLNSLGYMTTEQCMFVRQDEKMLSLFSSFKWYDSKTSKTSKEKRLISAVQSEATEVKDLIKSGMISETWAKNPPSIRYILRSPSEGNNDAPDYVYMLGGSVELTRDDMSITCREIASLYNESQTAFSSEKKDANTSKDNSGLDYSNIQGKSCIYHAFVGDIAKSYKENDVLLLAALKRRKMVRMINGIISFRNYLHYIDTFISKNNSNLETVLDFDASNSESQICKAVSLKSVLAKYEDAYQFCKNLIHTNMDIANCAWTTK